MKKIVVFLLGIAACFPVMAAPTRLYADVDTAAMNRWVESIMRTLSVPERIGQLFVAGVETKMTDANRATIKEYIEHCHVGGLLFFAIAAGVILVRHFTDDTIKDEEDVTKYLGLNTLAAIPLEHSEDTKKATKKPQQPPKRQIPAKSSVSSGRRAAK